MPDFGYLGEADILVSIVNLLRQNRISTKEYEKAVIQMANCQIHNPYGYSTTERLLEVLINLRTPRCEAMLLDLLYNENLVSIDGNFGYVRAKVLEVISLLKLDDEIINKIDDFLYSLSREEMENDLGLISNYLTFIRIQKRKIFFDRVTHMIIKLKKVDRWFDKIVATFFDSIKEYQYYHKHQFDENFYYWLAADMLSLKDCSVFRVVLSFFQQRSKTQREISNSDHKYINESFFLVNLFLKDEDELNKMTSLQWYKNCLSVHNDSQDLLKYLFTQNLDFIHSTISILGNLITKDGIEVSDKPETQFVIVDLFRDLFNSNLRSKKIISDIKNLTTQ